MADLNYLIIGCGGTGGAIAGHMARAGHSVSVIARGAHLKKIRQDGLRIIRPEEEFTVTNLKAYSEEEYLNGDAAGDSFPDVIFVCVKGYSLDSMIPFLKKTAGPQTVIIPILNLFGTGSRIQKQLPGILVTDGCMYVASQIKEPGCIWMNGNILRVVFGPRTREEFRPVLKQIEEDLNRSGIDAHLSENIRRDTMLKFSYVSPHGACGLFYDVPAGAIQKEGEIRDFYTELVREIDGVSKAMGIELGEDITARSLQLIDGFNPTMTTSLQRDIAAGKASELDGLVHEVVRLGEQYGVPVPAYQKVAERFPLSKRYGTDYALLNDQLTALMQTDFHFLPVLSNASALLMESLPDINWAGFYLIRQKESGQTCHLVLGPFQGKTACIHIALGKGVCGTAAARDRTIRVEDVHQFPGHIACDSASNSELVIVLHDRQTGDVAGVLDIDSPVFGRFTQEDQDGLEQFARTLESAILWS